VDNQLDVLLDQTMRGVLMEEMPMEAMELVLVLAQPDMVDFIAKSDLPVLKQISAARMAV